MSSAAGRFAKNSGTWEIAHRRAVRKEGGKQPQSKELFREVFWSVGGGALRFNALQKCLSFLHSSLESVTVFVFKGKV